MVDLQTSYGREPSFYRLWLDGYMTYSCANWDRAENLDQAQLDKLDAALDSLQLTAGDRLLDVGCGWGSLLRRAQERELQTVGLTPVEAQFEVVRSLGAVKARWQDWSPCEPFDAIASIGAFEHFGSPKKERRLDDYGAFFDWCKAALKPGGRLYLQTICVLDGKRIEPSRVVPILREFRRSTLPHSLAEISQSALPNFELLRLTGRRADYARTCRSWKERLQATREQALELCGERVVNHYESYFEAAAQAFDNAYYTLYQLVFRAL